MNKSADQSNLMSDFFKGAVKGIVTGALLIGAVWLVLSGLGALSTAFPALGLAAPDMAMFGMGHLTNLLGILLASGLVNGGMRAFNGARIEHHEGQGNMREARVIQSSPLLVPILGMEHSMAADHSIEMEHEHHRPQRQWAQSVNRSGDRVQEILQNGAMSDKDRASAILREREERAASPQGLSA